MSTFNALIGALDYPMLIVTAAAGDERDGCLVGFWTQTSIDPSRFLVCLSRKNRTYRIACDAGVLAVHVVPAGGEDLAELFGGETADEVDKLADVDWRSGPDGVPIVAACPNRFVGRVLDRLDTGDHVGFLLEPTEAQTGDQVDWLSFQQAKRIPPGHEA